MESLFILSDWYDFHMIDNLLKAFHAFSRFMLTSISVDELLLPRHINWFTNFRSLLLDHIRPETIKTFRRNRNVFKRNRSKTSQILRIRSIIEGVRAKNLELSLLFEKFPQGIRFHTPRKYGALAYGLSKERFTAIIKLYKNIKAIVCSPAGDTNFFEIHKVVWQGDILAPYLFIVC